MKPGRIIAFKGWRKTYGRLELQCLLLALGKVDLAHFFAVAHGEVGILVGAEDGFPELSGLPYEADANVAPGAEAANLAIRPRRRQGGQQVELSGMALQEHLRDACAASEVTVYLEGWVIVKEVR